jgi:hypothetical protein
MQPTSTPPTGTGRRNRRARRPRVLPQQAGCVNARRTRPRGSPASPCRLRRIASSARLPAAGPRASCALWPAGLCDGGCTRAPAPGLGQTAGTRPISLRRRAGRMPGLGLPPEGNSGDGRGCAARAAVLGVGGAPARPRERAKSAQRQRNPWAARGTRRRGRRARACRRRRIRPAARRPACSGRSFTQPTLLVVASPEHLNIPNIAHARDRLTRCPRRSCR